MVPSHDRTALLKCFAAQAANRPTAARQLLQVLNSSESRCIVTGQQPAIGGGPLYTLVKISHAIALAAARRTTGAAVVPIFWCASEDHDVGEAGHADFIDRHGNVQRFAQSLGEGRASLRFRLATAWWENLIAHAQRVLGPGLGHAWLEQHRPTATESMGQWTCRLLQELFAAHGLLCIEGHHLRPLWQSHIKRALDHWPISALEQLRSTLIFQGQADAFGTLTEPPLFADRADGRVGLSAAAAQELLVKEPLTLSPGAALRPILQQAALPADAYVAGPGELAYHAFLTPIYPALEVIAPTLIPRCSITLIAPWVSRALTVWNITPEVLQNNVSVSDIASSTHTFTPEITALRQTLATLEQQQARAKPAIARRLAAGIKRLKHEVSQLDASLVRQQQHDLARPALGHVRGQLFPKNTRQERVMSLFQVIWEHGPGIAEQLVNCATAANAGEHRWMKIS